MDQIMIEDLNVYAKHGVYTEENILGQQFLVSAIIDVDLAKAGQTDQLEHTVDYGSICHFVTSYMQEHTYHLIEAAAEHLAQELLMQYAPISKICIQVKKPWAPIGLPIKNVSVRIERARHSVYLSLGSNLGDRQAYIQEGIQKLDALASCRVCEVSGFLETEPYGGVSQGNFINCALHMETTLDAQRLLEALHKIEAEAGRTRDVHWGPRTLDMDILFYDDQVIHTPELTVPHADLANRAFVLEPMLAIAPWYRHPVLHETVRELYDKLMDKDKRS